MICQLAVFQGREVFAFTRSGDDATQSFARSLGAAWAGASDEAPPEPLDAAIIFAPAGPLVPKALEALAPDGVVVCAGIYMSDIPSFPYELLYHERKLRSVANLTRRDGEEFLAIAPKVPIRTTVTIYELQRAEEALADLRAGRFEGTAVVVPSVPALLGPRRRSPLGHPPARCCSSSTKELRVWAAADSSLSCRSGRSCRSARKAARNCERNLCCAALPALVMLIITTRPSSATPSRVTQPFP